jgi:CheY-like chemotaxis protein/two-component sensor histidine kinase
MEMAGNRIAAIVKGLKDFARGTDLKEKNPMSLNEAVENVARLAQSSVRRSGIQLQLDLGADLPPMIGNSQNIEQIVLNILINAVQAIKHEQGIVDIRTAYDESRGGLTLHVRDNGEGISTSLSRRIFDPFYTSRQGEGGTGLGLAVTHSLVREHKGQITFQSEPGEGTTFEVFFPLHTEEMRFKLLVVDDEPSVRRLLSKAFSKGSRFEVNAVKTGTEALLKIGTYRPDVLIMDLMMPGMDGLEVCQALRRSPELSDMTVVVITGYAEDPRVGRIRSLGYTHIYPKPLDTKEFVKDVEELVGKEKSVRSRQTI